MSSPALREKRRALLNQMLTADGLGRPVVRGIPRRDPLQPVPLSFSQERLWFLDRLAVASQFYVENSASRLGVEINSAVLEEAINKVVDRHEVLRVHFEMVDERPIQVPAASLHIPLPVVDLSALPMREQDHEVERLVLEHAMQPFNLGEAPLLRTRLLKLGSSNYIFLLAIHHIVSDGWSMGIFSREVSEWYTALVAGRTAQLPSLPIQYPDYAAWQREDSRNETFNQQLAYWQRQLRDLTEIQLPLDHERPAALTYKGAHLEVAIPANLSASLRVMSRREQATLFMTSLALFATVLNLHTGQTDLAIGTPIAGRNRGELEGLIGVFLNTLILRLDLSGDPSFRTLLQRVKRTALAAYDNQDVPFDRLVEVLQPERDLGKNPLFQILFQFFTPPDEKSGASAMQPETIPVERGTAILDLSWHLWDTPQGIKGRIEYSTEIFEAESVQRHFSHFVTLLSEVVAHPDVPLSQLNVVTGEERKAALQDWQGAVQTWPDRRSLIERFEDLAAEAPDAVAIIEPTKQTTRYDLNSYVNRLARYLSELGIKAGDRVAICLERSAEMTAAALAVLKAGGAYVPLDPAYPVERLRYLLEDSGARILISNRVQANKITLGSARIVCLDEDANAITRQSSENLGIKPDPLDAAYLIYTSGSTGQPKGVVGLHGATINRFEWMWCEFPFETGEVACQRAALSFVDSIWEMFGPLLAGIQVVIIPNETGKDPAATVRLLAQYGVTRLLTVPSLLQALLESGVSVRAELPKLRLWFCSGERLSDDLVRRFREALPDRELINLYGSSEVAGDLLFERVGREKRTTIGRPMANCLAYVLGPGLRLMPPGVAGDLFVAGANLARGYLDRPEMTAERLLPNPFSAEPGARMYATGDRARQLPDGRFEFIGRSDHQVKVRGFRIELEEVESALRRHPRVRDVAVRVHDDGAGGSLIAYAAANDDPPTNEEVRSFAASQLPEHMVPAAIVWVESLPLMPNGKLDRSALTKIEGTITNAEFLPPQTEVERALAAIWTDLLGVPRVGAFDNFFDLGGHSLLAIRLVSRLRDQFDIEMPLREVFLRPTLSQLASAVEAGLLDEIEMLSDEDARLRLSPAAA
jgi:amino acid adenylation domain-containing protein